MKPKKVRRTDDPTKIKTTNEGQQASMSDSWHKVAWAKLPKALHDA